MSQFLCPHCKTSVIVEKAEANGERLCPACGKGFNIWPAASPVGEFFSKLFRFALYGLVILVLLLGVAFAGCLLFFRS